MKRIYFACSLIVMSITCYAQWTGQSGPTDLTSTIGRTGRINLDGYNTSQIRLNSNGTYYGKIGNPSPQVWSLGWGTNGNDINPTLSWTPAGRIGIGTTAPGAKLSFNDLNDGTNNADGITWYNPDPASYGIYRTAGPWSSPNYQQLMLSFDTGIILNPGSGFGKSYVDIQGSGLRVTSGNVGITDTKGYKLAVAGNVVAEEVNVKLQANWPDYVFENDYSLPSLEVVKSYIDQNKHLPEVPSAKEMEANGINLSEMNVLLLKKVEELTLYMIETKKELSELKSENNEIKRRLNHRQ